MNHKGESIASAFAKSHPGADWKEFAKAFLKQHAEKQMADQLDEIQQDAHESTLDAVFQFDLMTKLGFKLNFLTGEFEK